MFNEQMIRKFAPSVFSQTAHPRTSERYVMVPTTDIIERFEQEGFLVTHASQSRSRIKTGGQFVAHMIKLRHADSILQPKKLALHDTVNEIVLINSHDATRRLRFLAGLLNLVCTNGLMLPVPGAPQFATNIRHSGANVLDAVYEAGVWVVKTAASAQKAIKGWKEITLDAKQQDKFAREVSELVTGDPKRLPASELLEIRHEPQAAPNLWNIFNRAQESIMRGGMRLTSDHGRPSRSRPITNAMRTADVNTALWGLAEKWAA